MTNSFLCPCHTLPKMNGDGHTTAPLFTISRDRTNIGPFVQLSFGIVGPPLYFLTHRPQLREWRKNLWQAKKVPKQVAKVHCRVEFVCPSCRSWDHREDILSSRVMFLFSSCVYRRNRLSFIMRTYYEHYKKLPDCVRKATRLREWTSRPSLIHRVACAAWMQPGQNRTRTGGGDWDCWGDREPDCDFSRHFVGFISLLSFLGESVPASWTPSSSVSSTFLFFWRNLPASFFPLPVPALSGMFSVFF